MKKIILLLTVFSLFTVSCDDFLDLKPKTSWSGLNFPTEETHLEGLLYGGYERLQSVLSTGFLVYGEMRADVFKVNAFSVNNDKIVNNKLDYGMSQSSWAGFYEVIKQANLVLEYTPDLLENNKTTQAKANELMGEAYCLRALSYFYIVRIWGDAPLITKPYLTKDDLNNLSREPIDSILVSIHNDLSESADLIPAGNTSRTRFTRTAANAIDAHVYAWEHKYDKVIEKADLVLGNGEYALAQLYDVNLDSNSPTFVANVQSSAFAQIFNVGKNKESIFELAFSLQDGDDSRQLNSYLSSSYPYLRPHVEYASSFNPLDWRSIVANRYSSLGSYTAIKFTIGFNMVEDSRNIVLFRLGDIYLLKAEALANMEDTDQNRKDAMKLVNDIRRRAGGTSLEITEEIYLDRNAYSHQAIKDLILEERKFELCYEGHRWFDLVRCGKAVEILRDRVGIDIDPAALVWPIFIEEIRRSSNIEQNEYYK